MKNFKQDFSDSQSPLANPLFLAGVKHVTSSHNSRFKTLVDCKIPGDLSSSDELNQHYVNLLFYNLIVTHVHM